MEKYGIARQGTNDNTIRRMRFACWITKATDINSEYVVLIACPLQQWLHHRASILRYTYIARLVNPLKPNDLKKRRTAQLTSRCCILYIYSTNIRTEYFKHAA